MQTALSCTICRHPKVDEIDEALRLGELSYNAISIKFDRPDTRATSSSLWRHTDHGHHLRDQQEPAAPQAEPNELGTALQEAEKLLKAQLSILAAAQQAGRHTASVQGSVAVGRTIELISKLNGDLKAVAKGGSVNGDLRLVDKIMRALDDEQLRVIVKITEEQRTNINAIAIEGGMPPSSLLRPVDESRFSTDEELEVLTLRNAD